jgi:hypothetical protein
MSGASSSSSSELSEGSSTAFRLPLFFFCEGSDEDAAAALIADSVVWSFAGSNYGLYKDRGIRVWQGSKNAINTPCRALPSLQLL